MIADRDESSRGCRGAPRASRSEQRQGYNLVHWNKGGMAYWAVADLNGAELSKFAALMRDDGTPAVPPA